MKQQELVKVNTLVRVYEGEMLTARKLAALLHAPDAAAARKLLEEWRCFRFADVSSVSPDVVSEEAAGWLAWIQKQLPGGAGRYFALEHTVQNVKILLKQTLSGQELPASEKERLSAVYPENSPEQRLQSCARAALAEAQASGAFADIDYRLDAFYFEELLRLAKETADADILKLTQARIDLYHLSALLQSRVTGVPPARAAMADGGFLQPAAERLFGGGASEQDALLRETPYRALWEETVKNPRLFDVHADDYLLNLCKKAKLQAFGLFPVYAFLFAKLRELRVVRMILAGKRQGLPETMLLERTGTAYAL